MAGKIETRLAELGIELPDAPIPKANYMPFVVSGNLVFMSGQVTLWNGEMKYIGKIGAELSVDEGYDAARMVAINLIAQAKNACGGDLDRIRQVVKLTAVVNAVEDFKDHSKVVNGASDLMAEVFGDAGRCVRINSGGTIPFGFAVEIDAIFEIE